MKDRNHFSSKFVRMTFCLLFLLLLMLCACSREPAEVKLGFSGCLSGKLSDLGTSGRDGTILAVEECNASGGINGQLVELIVKDDAHDGETTLRVDQELADAGVAAVIGHMTSGMTIKGKPVLEKNGVLMISPTASSDQLTGLDDNLIRVTGASISQAEHLAEYAGKQLKLQKLAVIYDLSNKAYTQTLYQAFKELFEKNGGQVQSETTFTSGPGTSFSALADQSLEKGPDSFFILAGGIDTAMICQQLDKKGVDVPVISSAWAKTQDFIQNGGKSVEGVVFSQSFNQSNVRQEFQAFKNRFNKRFGHDPDFGAVFAFEAVQIFISSMKQNSDPKQLKKTILEQQEFEGLQSPIRFDAFGDTKRKRFLYTVKNGEFTLLENE